MKAFLLLIFILLTTGGASAQYIASFVIDSLPAEHDHESVFIAGNFNQWKADDSAMTLTRNKEGKLSISVEYTHIPGDRLEYKFTRGSWPTSECTTEGKLVGPRLAKPYKDTLIHAKIEGWRDDFPSSTASKNVNILKDSFYMPQLNRYRKIWIYLPEGYATSNIRYPVLYMQDGQHLFDEATSRGRIGPIEWAVDETLDARQHAGIVVGIDHNPDMSIRIPEFFYHANQEVPKAEGKAYLTFIVETLKPYVDTHYRTLANQQHTALAGSSLGGLISLYGGLKYPEVFGWIGVFSPSIWLDHGQIEKEIQRLKTRKIYDNQHYFFYSGTAENREIHPGNFVKMTDDVNRLIDLLQTQIKPDIEQLITPYGRHGALYWRDAFPVFYAWMWKRMNI